MSYPVFMAGTDISGLQPSGSIIITSTQAAGLGFLIMRRWRGGKHTIRWRGKIGQRPSATAFPPAKSANTRAPWGQFSLFLSFKKSDGTDPWRGKSVIARRPGSAPPANRPSPNHHRLPIRRNLHPVTDNPPIHNS